MHKHISWIVIGGCAFLLQPLFCQNTDNWIFPDPNRKISLVIADGNEGTLLSGTSLPPDSDLGKKISHELAYSFHQSIIKLSQCSRNFTGDANGPNVLFLSRTEGGFPRQGLILKDQGRIAEYPELYYVDLVLDEQRLARGDLDIFSHEMGHVMMLNIWKNMPEQRSNKQHVSMGVTDYSTALFEGWGIHFQRLCYDSTPDYLEKYHNSFHYSQNVSRSWHSNIDQDLRINGVLQNIYIHPQLLPAVNTADLDQEQLILLEHASPIFDKTRLRNAQQMLSCEGVLATLFYRISSNRMLQENYEENNFYLRFLLRPLSEDITPRDLFSPFENVMLKHFWIWSRLDKNLSENQVPAVEYIKEWGRSFPEDKEEVYKIFLLTTLGKTASNRLGKIYEKLAFSGMQGDITRYRRAVEEFRQEYKTLIENALQDEVDLAGEIGPQLWVQNPHLLMRKALWSPSPKRPLWINLNTATVYEIASFPNVSMEDAQRIVLARNEKGYFSTWEEAKSLGLKLD